MRNLVRVTVALCFISSLAACDFLKKKGADADAAAAAADEAGAAAAATDAAAVPATTGGTGAANENDVARFPDETALGSVAATTKRFANLRESPGTGKVVLPLNAGTNVTELASRQTFFLVTVDASGTKKLGWVSNDAFSAAADAGLHPPKCTGTDVPLMGDAPFCGKVCGGDVDCPAGSACKGTAQRFSANTLLPGTVAVCTVVNTGRVPVTAVIDAGAPPAVPTVLSQSPDITAPPCAGGFTLLQKDKRCHRLCAAGVGVKTCSLFCIRCEGQTVCSDTRACP
jgi:hypothetical protein